MKKINKEIEGFSSRENNYTDSTNGICDFLNQISDSVQEEFDELLSRDSEKKRFVRVRQKYSHYCLAQKLTLPKKLNGSLKLP